ncbi:putative protein conserved in bacteria, partial [Dysosmobacter welbionis]
GPSWSGCRTCWPRRRIWRTLSPSNPPSPTRSWRSSGSPAPCGSMTPWWTTPLSISPSRRCTSSPMWRSRLPVLQAAWARPLLLAGGGLWAHWRVWP